MFVTDVDLNRVDSSLTASGLTRDLLVVVAAHSRVGIVARCGTSLNRIDSGERLNGIAILNAICLAFARHAVLAR